MTIEPPVEVKSRVESKAKDPSNFLKDLEELSKEEIIDRLLNLCQMNGLLGFCMLSSLINNHPTTLMSSIDISISVK